MKPPGFFWANGWLSFTKAFGFTAIPSPTPLDVDQAVGVLCAGDTWQVLHRYLPYTHNPFDLRTLWSQSLLPHRKHAAATGDQGRIVNCSQT